ncbi:putative odorant receptor 92a [Trichogramma pretiosum]|uniref:putative odorant receptor 92a n=1 Tax=Trichogramma pretiosum TaxID=7493 RepID=UPI000C719FF1|nr:putative odorant receptor 92a [Trichogramma pretiosum]
MVVMRLLYLSCALVQMFIYCYFGNKLTSKSEEFALGLFASNWTDLSIKSKKKILFMITRSMKSVSISKLFYMVLSLDSFVNILRISYAVLNFMRRNLVVCQTAGLLLTRQSFDEFNETFFVVLSTGFASFKGSCDLWNRAKIIRLVDMLSEPFCLARCQRESAIQKTYDQMGRKIEIIMLCVVELAAVIFLFGPLINHSRELPYKVLLPYDLNDTLIFSLSYVHQTFSCILVTAGTMTNNALIVGFMMQLCSQLDILKLRFRKASDKIKEQLEKEVASGKLSNRSSRQMEVQIIRELAQHHLHAYNLAETLCDTFYGIIVGEFCINSLVICVSVYKLSLNAGTIPEILFNALYLVCVTGEFFVYCYFGNEITYKSTTLFEAIAAIDWNPMSKEFKKNIIFIMSRASKPIFISCGAYVYLTLESFMAVVKLSFSVFNVLKSTL